MPSKLLACSPRASPSATSADSATGTSFDGETDGVELELTATPPREFLLVNRFAF